MAALLPADCKFTYRYVDFKRLPHVYGLALGGIGGGSSAGSSSVKTKSSSSYGRMMVTPMRLSRFDDIPSKQTVSKLVGDRLDSKEKKRRRRHILRKYDQRRASSEGAEDIDDDDDYDGSVQVLLLFPCPCTAAAEAATTSSSTRVQPTQMEMSEAKRLGDCMGVPMCVLLNSWCETEDGCTRAEVYLRMPDRAEGAKLRMQLLRSVWW